MIPTLQKLAKIANGLGIKIEANYAEVADKHYLVREVITGDLIEQQKGKILDKDTLKPIDVAYPDTIGIVAKIKSQPTKHTIAFNRDTLARVLSVIPKAETITFDLKDEAALFRASML